MQDFRSMVSGGGGGGGRIFGSERRLRPFPNQALKCPRCDSLNTKFCYYNNYNLSQPRHFCKSCRRYWTKGGVLRNVPVGGGCRKTKRSKPKSSTEIDKAEKKSTSHSSSDSSSLTATTTTTEAASTSSAATLLNSFPESSILLSQNPTSNNASFEQSIMQLGTNSLDQGSESVMFPETGGFTGLMNASSNPVPFLGFNFSDISPFRFNHEQEQQHTLQEEEQQQQQQIQMEQQKMVEELKFQELTKGLYDQTVPLDLHGLSNRTTCNGGGLTALDWQQSSNGGGGGVDHQGLFDLPNSTTTTTSTVDHHHHHHQSFWSQTSQWTENDHTLYLP